jgi:hypothetical protein
MSTDLQKEFFRSCLWTLEDVCQELVERKDLPMLRKLSLDIQMILNRANRELATKAEGNVVARR